MARGAFNDGLRTTNNDLSIAAFHFAHSSADACAASSRVLVKSRSDFTADDGHGSIAALVTTIAAADTGLTHGFHLAAGDQNIAGAAGAGVTTTTAAADACAFIAVRIDFAAANGHIAVAAGGSTPSAADASGVDSSAFNGDGAAAVIRIVRVCLAAGAALAVPAGTAADACAPITRARRRNAAALDGDIAGALAVLAVTVTSAADTCAEPAAGSGQAAGGILRGVAGLGRAIVVLIVLDGQFAAGILVVLFQTGMASISILAAGQLIIAVQLNVHVAVAGNLHGGIGGGFDIGVFQGDVGFAVLIHIHRNGVGGLCTLVAYDGDLIVLFLLRVAVDVVLVTIFDADLDAAFVDIVRSRKGRSRHGCNDGKGRRRGQNTEGQIFVPHNISPFTTVCNKTKSGYCSANSIRPAAYDPKYGVPPPFDVFTEVFGFSHILPPPPYRFGKMKS